MGDAKTHMWYHTHHCHPTPRVPGVPLKAGDEDAEEQHRSPVHPLPLQPPAPHSAAGHARVK